MARSDYDVVVIGGGAGGLSVASACAQLGAKVALVEKTALGGDCLFHGCVPSKALIRAATLCHEARNLNDFGIMAEQVRVDFSRVMERVHKVIEEVGRPDDPDRFRKMGVNLFFGEGSFRDPHHFQIDGQTLSAHKFVIATGAGPAPPPIPGLQETGHITNRTVFDLKELPPTMIVLGGGPIGVELGQAFQRLGSQVTIIDMADCLLSREDPEISELLQSRLAGEGMRILTKSKAKKVTIDKSGNKCVTVEKDGEETVVTGTEILVGLGRAPNTSGLGLDNAGVKTDQRGWITVDRRLRTSQKHIFALGDCSGAYQFTHMAEYEASIVVPNVLYGIPRKADYRVVPWATFCDPEVARVGITEQEAREQGYEPKVFRYSLEEADRPIIDGQNHGLIKLVCRGKKLLGAHIIGHRASDLLHEYVLTMTHNMPITHIYNTIHVYPALAQVVRRAVGQYYTEKIHSSGVKLLHWLFRLRGTIGSTDN